MLQLAALRFVQPIDSLRSSSYLPVTKVSIDLNDTRPKERKKRNALDQLVKEVMEPQPDISRIKRARLVDDADIVSSGNNLKRKRKKEKEKGWGGKLSVTRGAWHDQFF